jgi:hypothetical protein
MQVSLGILEKVIKAQKLISAVFYSVYLCVLIVVPILAIGFYLVDSTMELPKSVFSGIYYQFGGRREFMVGMSTVALILIAAIVPLKHTHRFFLHIDEIVEAFKTKNENYELRAVSSLEKASRSALICVIFSYAMACAGIIINSMGIFDKALSANPPKAVNYFSAGDFYQYFIPSLSGFTGVTLFVVMAFAAHIWKEKIRINSELAAVSEIMNLTI